MRREYHAPLRNMPQFRFKNPQKHYPQGLVDRGLVRPAVNQLAKIWQTDYETAHKMILAQRGSDA